MDVRNYRDVSSGSNAVRLDAEFDGSLERLKRLGCEGTVEFSQLIDGNPVRALEWITREKFEASETCKDECHRLTIERDQAYLDISLTCKAEQKELRMARDEKMMILGGLRKIITKKAALYPKTVSEKEIEKRYFDKNQQKEEKEKRKLSRKKERDDFNRAKKEAKNCAPCQRSLAFSKKGAQISGEAVPSDEVVSAGEAVSADAVPSDEAVSADAVSADAVPSDEVVSADAVSADETMFSDPMMTSEEYEESLTKAFNARCLKELAAEEAVSSDEAASSTNTPSGLSLGQLERFVKTIEPKQADAKSTTEVVENPPPKKRGRPKAPKVETAMPVTPNDDSLITEEGKDAAKKKKTKKAAQNQSKKNKPFFYPIVP